ncbi:unnamed protein product [Schistosoma margrebowiei]|uniref:beta-mannosidase n=1 Tax=Schistosoma margrebowiei TaxID=48269 RepID=A0A183MUK9_9TREM|nr:unnamed protein product [Schistosoma margrebowiei]
MMSNLIQYFFSIFYNFIYISTVLSYPNIETKWIPLIGNWIISNQTISKQIYTKFGLDSYSTQWIIDNNNNNNNNPFIDDNDIKLRWIAYDNWTFTKIFIIEQFNLNNTIELYMDGIDTFCEITLNNHLLGVTENSFLLYTWKINHLLNLKQINILEIKCISTVLMAKKKAELMKVRKKLIPLPFCWPSRFYGECHINLVRTTQSIFGWDWGLTLPIQGLWTLPQLVISPSGLRFGERFKFYTYSQHDQFKLWSAEIDVEIVDNMPSYDRLSKVCIYSYIEELNVFGKKCFGMENKMVTMEVLRNQSKVKLWWPIGTETGPYLYTLVLYLTVGFNKIVDKKEYSIGFREVELIEDYVDSSHIELGRTFYFKINGLPIFITGANWIPARYMPGRQYTLMHNVTNDRIWLEKRLLRSASLSGINLIRIWGGGRYEDDEFYKEADRLGLMIWHDMMFAVATYPDKERNDTVEEEIRRQISRLHYHPSIIVWSTDNEVKQAIANGWYGPPMDLTLLSIFKSRFFESIFNVINDEENGRSSARRWEASKYKPRRCLISSPGNGYLTEKFRGLDPDPDNPLYGDIHYYTYSGDLWSESNYVLGRFISEFGIQSIPSPLAWARSISNISDPKQWDVFGSLMDHRQHHQLGHQMLRLALEYITEPANRQDPIRNYSRWAYVSQLNQLMCLRTQINLYMRHKCRLKLTNFTIISTNKFITMGTIYWQLNDIWSTPSWSTIDSVGQWKLSHYNAIKEYYDLTKWGRIAIHHNNEIIEADWIPNTNNKNNNLFPIEFELICYTIWSFIPTYREMLNISIKHFIQCPINILNKSLNDLNKLCHFNHRNGRIIQIIIKNNLNSIISDRNLLLLDKPIQIKIWPRNAGKALQIKSIKLLNNLLKIQKMAPFLTNHIYEIIIESKSPELFINLDIDPRLDVEFWFSINGFHLINENEKIINLFISGNKTISIDVLKYYLWIESLATLNMKEL